MKKNFLILAVLLVIQMAASGCIFVGHGGHGDHGSLPPHHDHG